MPRSTLKAGVRRTYIVGLLCHGARTAAEIADKFNEVALTHPQGILRRVTIDTIQRDLVLLVKEKSIEKRRSATKGHEMGGGSWVAYAEYEVPMHLRPGTFSLGVF